MRIELNRMHYPVTVLGFGIRAGIWLQGCSIRCRGCVSQDTWQPEPSLAVETEQVLDWVRGLPPDKVDGVTISGGEPFDQPEALSALLGGIRQWRRTRLSRGLPDADVLCFSGYSLGRLRTRHAGILDLLDVVVSEPYLASRPSASALRGSGNQRLTRLSQLGDLRYSDERLAQVGRRRFQVTADDDAIWYIGIPARGDMERLEAMMTGRGVRQGRPSWRA